jgi:hypothetical protein
MRLHSDYPELLLTLAGFERAPDRGWQIPFKYKKPTKGNIWLPPHEWIPTERLHALVVMGEINLHLDVQKGGVKRRKHKSFARSNRVDFIGYLLNGLNRELTLTM